MFIILIMFKMSITFIMFIIIIVCAVTLWKEIPLKEKVTVARILNRKLEETNHITVIT